MGKAERNGDERWWWSAIPAAMIVLPLLAPLMEKIGEMTGRELVLRSFYTEGLLIVLCALALTLMHPRAAMNRFGQVCAMVMLPAVLLGMRHLPWDIAAMFLVTCVPLTALAYRKHARKRSVLRRVSSALSIFGIVILTGFVILGFIFKDFGMTGRTAGSLSPDGSEIASIWYSDQGALGGDEFLEVHESGEGINVLIGHLREYRRYRLDWPYWNPEGHEVQWIDGHTVRVDKIEMDVSKRGG